MSENGQKYSNLNKRLKAGITGGIGSGKTTVCRIFETLGVPVFYADDRAKAIMMEDPAVVQQIRALFGPESYQRDGRLNRAYLSSIVFHNKKMLAGLNAIVHPAVFADGERWHEAQSDSAYTLKEAALLFESGGYKLLDKIITVFAPVDVRIGRVMKRDGVSKDEVMARMKNQLPDEEKMKLADFVIYNDGSRPLIPQVWQIHRKICEMAAIGKGA